MDFDLNDSDSESESDSICLDNQVNTIMNEIDLTFNMALGDIEQDNQSDNDSLSVSSSASTQACWIDTMNEDDIYNLEYTVLDMMNDYIECEMENLYMASFQDTMIRDIIDMVVIQLNGMGIDVDDDDDDLEEFVQRMYNELTITNPALIARSQPTFTPELLMQSEKQIIDKKLEDLYNNEGHKYKQRSREWYEYRAGLITASNLWKVFSTSQSVQNSLIYEKCNPFVMSSSLTQTIDEDESSSSQPQSMQPLHNSVNTRTPFHWGNKYEPISIKIYEQKYKTRIAEFGCIRHPIYPFIGASPDGINVDRESTRYGRMIEVKNIYNRDITGIPKDEYWVQMQFQMETCGLTQCDFIETRFKEYSSESEFYENEFVHETRGVILYFVERESMLVGNINPYYVYMPLYSSLEKEHVDQWISIRKDSMKSNYHLYEVIYWYLDEFSCVLVELNKPWIDHVIPKVESFWQIICREKITGYEHRGAKKRASTTKEDAQNTSSNRICLIKLDSDGNPLS